MLTIIGGPDYHASRSFKELWNIGHILLFALLSFYCLKYWEFFVKKRKFSQIIILFIITASLSIIIELSQHIFANGIPDLSDIRRNFVGTIVGIVLTASFRKKYILYFLRCIVILFVLFEMVPVSLVLADEFRASRQFPILSNFESDLELSRWLSDEPFIRSEKHVIQGKSALQIIFGTQKYSSVSLRHFPGDWTNYQYLKYHLFYLENDTLNFSCLIHDELHTRGAQANNDRFIQRCSLVNGWNEIAIPLEHVKNSLKTRKMNMSKIRGVDIYTIQLPEPKKVYLDYVRLER